MQNAKINSALIADQNAGIRVIFHGKFSFREPYSKICFCFRLWKKILLKVSFFLKKKRSFIYFVRTKILAKIRKIVESMAYVKIGSKDVN